MHTRMQFARTLGTIAGVGGSLWLAAACSSDHDIGNRPNRSVEGGGGKASGGAAAAATGGKSSGGVGGAAAAATGGKSSGSTASGGASGNADSGARSSGGTGGRQSADASTDTSDATSTGGANGTDVGDASNADAGTPENVLLVGSGWSGTRSEGGEVVALDLASRRVLARNKVDLHSDLFPVASGGKGFMFAGGYWQLDTLSPTMDQDGYLYFRSHLDGAVDDGVPGVPSGLVYVPPAGHASAYISILGQNPDGNGIVAIDLDPLRVRSFVSMTPFRDPNVDQSFAAIVGSFYDATTARAYFVLRHDVVRASGLTPPCLAVPGLLIAIDPSTDHLVDLNGATAGVALPLSLGARNIVFDKSGRRVLIAGNCLDGDAGRSSGVESVNLDSLATQLLYASTADALSVTLLGPDSAVLTSYDGANVTSNRWIPSSPALGAPLTGFPPSGLVEGPDSVVDVVQDSRQARVIRYEVSSQTTTTVVENIWGGVFFDSINGTALVRASDRQ